MNDDFERTPGGAILMDGNRLRDETVARLRSEIEALGSPPVCLATVLVGADKPSQIYVRMKQKKADEAGMVSKGVELPETATQADVEAVVGDLAADPSVHGILVQLPLPAHLDPEPVLALLPPEKDVDGLTELSMGRLVRGLPGHVPCTPLGVMRLLDRYGVATPEITSVNATLKDIPVDITPIFPGAGER
jgi:methylenetetrahydrofolate dehydrogenase (NADP+)/methenyltetrahydrofolate cyclohydrolase